MAGAISKSRSVCFRVLCGDAMTKQNSKAGKAGMTLADMEARSDEVATILKTLAHPMRLMLACSLVEAEYSVGGLEEKLNIHQPNLSQQLTVLRESGIVETRREGKQIFYRLTQEKAARLIGALFSIYCAAGSRP
jgi:DNA-binding transcriptional ArsR family regulator